MSTIPNKPMYYSLEIRPAQNGCVIYANCGSGNSSEIWVEHAPADIGKLVAELSKQLMADYQKT